MLETLILLAILLRASRVSVGDISSRVFDALAVDGEQRLGPRLWLFLLPLGLMVLGSLYVRPSPEPVAMGHDYAALARAPFAASSNPVAHRFLTPLISYTVGLRGNGILITNLVLASIFLGLVLRYFRPRAQRPGDSVIAAFVMMYSLVTLTTIYYGGYCDSLTYVLVFLMWWHRQRSALFHALFFLALLNRESVAFLAPWFLFLRLLDRSWKSVLVELMSLGLVLGTYGLVRYGVAQGQDVQLSVGYYLKPLAKDPFHWARESAAYWGLGLFTVFKLLWVIPIVAAAMAWQRGERRVVWSILLIVVCSYAQLLVAFDTSRMLTLSFPAMIVAIDYLLRTEATGIRRYAAWLLLANLFVPQLFTARDKVEVMHSMLAHMILY